MKKVILGLLILAIVGIFLVIGIFLISNYIQQKQAGQEGQARVFFPAKEEQEIKWTDLKKQTASPIVVILTDQETYQGLTTEINRFAQDIKNDLGTEPRIFHQNYRDAKEVKNHLLAIKQESDFDGIILLGEIPVPLLTTELSFAGESRDPSPSDSYYADLDAYQYEEKTDAQGNIYFYLEIPEGGFFPAGAIRRWIGRITAPVEAENKIQLIREYLNRNHEYKTGKLNYEDEILVFLPDEFGCKTLELNECIENTREGIAQTYFFDRSSVNPLVYGQGDYAYLRQTYLNEIKKPYSVVLVNAHGSAGLEHNPSISFNEIKTAKPQAMFFDLRSCAAAKKVNSEKSIAQWYLFSGNTLVVTAPSVWVMSVSIARLSSLESELRKLAVGFRIYEAIPTRRHDILLGDPTLKIKKIDTDCNLVFSHDVIDLGTTSSPVIIEEWLENIKTFHIKNIGTEKCVISLFKTELASSQTSFDIIRLYAESYSIAYWHPEKGYTEIQPQETISFNLSLGSLSSTEMVRNLIISRSGYLKIVSNDLENIVRIPYQGKINVVSVCGDKICEAEESGEDCCIDCGCPANGYCDGNTCKYP